MSWNNRARHKLWGDMDALEIRARLPYIKGRWFFVDPENGSATNIGTEPDEAFASWITAVAACTTGDGDGICLISSGTTTAHTTSYFKTPQTLSLNGVTVYGLAAPVSMYGRARIANTEVTTGAVTTISTDSTDDVYTINRSSGSFITNGFVAGQTITFAAGTDHTNDGNYTIASVAALSLTVTESLTTKTAVALGTVTVTSYNAQMLTVSGSNNSFYNIHIGNFGTLASAIGGVKVTGHRNYFGNCHFIGAGNATPGAVAGAYDVMLDGAQENTFERCTFGTDSVLKAAANGELLLVSGVWRNNFIDCTFMSYSATAGKIAVKSADAAAVNGIMDFTRCKFLNWNENGITAVNDVFGGTTPTSGAYSVTPDSICVGYTGWGANVYVAGAAAAASAGGQIATTE